MLCTVFVKSLLDLQCNFVTKLDTARYRYEFTLQLYNKISFIATDTF